MNLDDARLVAAVPSLDVIELDRALEAFATVDARRSEVVELRFFGGLTVEETAEVPTSPLKPSSAIGDWPSSGCSVS